jgi:hypothetical protein
MHTTAAAGVRWDEDNTDEFRSTKSVHTALEVMAGLARSALSARLSTRAVTSRSPRRRQAHQHAATALASVSVRNRHSLTPV